MDMERKGETLIVRMDSELDHHYAEIIRDKIDKEVRLCNIRHLIFDFTNVRFMDSSGIGVIMGRFKLMNSVGGRVSVFSMSAQMEKIIKMSGINKLVGVYETESEVV